MVYLHDPFPDILLCFFNVLAEAHKAFSVNAEKEVDATPLNQILRGVPLVQTQINTDRK